MNPLLHPRLVDGTRYLSRRSVPAGYPKVWRRLLLARGRCRFRHPLRQRALPSRPRETVARVWTEEEDQTSGPCSFLVKTTFQDSGRHHVA